MKLSHLKQIQNNAGYTLCAGRDHFLYVSHARGIAPIMDMLAKDRDYFHECIITDTIIGKAAAMMLTSSHVSYIHARVMSEAAIAFLTLHGITHSYEQSCPCIVNRTGSGMCPMEQSVQTIDDMEEAYQALTNTLIVLRNA